MSRHQDIQIWTYGTYLTTYLPTYLPTRTTTIVGANHVMIVVNFFLQSGVSSSGVTPRDETVAGAEGVSEIEDLSAGAAAVPEQLKYKMTIRNAGDADMTFTAAAEQCIAVTDTECRYVRTLGLAGLWYIDYARPDDPIMIKDMEDYTWFADEYVGEKGGGGTGGGGGGGGGTTRSEHGAAPAGGQTSSTASGAAATTTSSTSTSTSMSTPDLRRLYIGADDQGDVLLCPGTRTHLQYLNRKGFTEMALRTYTTSDQMHGKKYVSMSPGTFARRVTLAPGEEWEGEVALRWFPTYWRVPKLDETAHPVPPRRVIRGGI